MSNTHGPVRATVALLGTTSASQTTFYDMPADLKMEVIDASEPDFENPSRSGRTSRFQPVVDKWRELSDEGEDKKIRLQNLTNSQVQNLRRLMYRAFDKQNVIVRSNKRDDDNFNVTVRKRKGNEYLRSG
jgi:hypothetical protein